MGFDELVAYNVARERKLKEFQGVYGSLNPSNNWYVNASVSASGNGKTPEVAFKTIQEAVDSANSGDTIIVGTGIYDENLYTDGLRIDKTIRLIGNGFSTQIRNTNALATSVIHFIGDTGTTNIVGCELIGFYVAGDEGVVDTLVSIEIDQDHRFMKIIGNAIISADSGKGINLIVKRGDRIHLIKENTFANGRYCIYIHAIEDGTLSGDDNSAVYFIEENTFIITGIFEEIGSYAGIYIEGDTVNDVQLVFVTIFNNKFGVNVSGGAITLGEKTAMCFVMGNIFGATLAEFGAGAFIKDENLNGILSGDLGNVVKGNLGLFEKDEYSHGNGDGLEVTMGTGSWVGGNYVEFFAQGAITKHFYVESIAFEEVSQEDVYYIEIGIGTAGGELSVLSWKGRLQASANLFTVPLDLDGRPLTAGTRVAIKGSSKLGSNTIRMSLNIKTME